MRPAVRGLDSSSNLVGSLFFIDSVLKTIMLFWALRVVFREEIVPRAFRGYR
jgi:hypothetical protein